MKVNQVAWSVRSAAGEDRRLMANAITEAGNPSIDQRQRLSEKDGIIGALWPSIDNTDSLSLQPPQLRAAIINAREYIFTSYAPFASVSSTNWPTVWRCRSPARNGSGSPLPA